MRRLWGGALVAVLATGGCAVKLNGKSYGPGAESPGGGSSSRGTSASGPSSGSGSRAPASESDAARAAREEAERQAYEKKKEPEAYPTQPADPWAAVAGDQPITIDDDQQHYFRVRDDAFACTAKVDHCFPTRTWLVVQDGDARITSQAALHGIDPKGDEVLPVFTRGDGHLNAESFTAYRSVPATRKNLVPGAQVFVLPFPTEHPGSAMDAFNRTWTAGVVERVDWDMGFVFVKGQPKQFWITSARVGVLSWRPGGKVAIVGGGTRDSIKVSASEVIVPGAAQ